MKKMEILAVLITTIAKHAPGWYEVLNSKGRDHQKIRWAFYHTLHHEHNLPVTIIAKECGKTRSAIKYGLQQYRRRYLKR